MKCILSAFSFAAASAIALVATAAPMYVESFETDQTANWTVNVGPAGALSDKANLFFDYSTVGVPAAPSASGTHGLKLVANLSAGIFSGLSASPTGKDFGSVYKLSFDWWANFNGPAPVGGSGSTQLSTFGVGTSGTTVQWPGGAQSSVWFAATGDGNSSSDWRAYSSGPGATSYTAASGVYAAGTGTAPDARSNTHPHYAGFGSLSAPAAQLALFPQQTGTTVVGSAAFAWHKVEINKTLTDVSWTVDGLRIATVPLSSLSLSGNNIFFGHSDSNATSSTDVNDEALLFTLIDNVQVVPEPTSAALCLFGVAGLLVRRRR